MGGDITESEEFGDSKEQSESENPSEDSPRNATGSCAALSLSEGSSLGTAGLSFGATSLHATEPRARATTANGQFFAGFIDAVDWECGVSFDVSDEWGVGCHDDGCEGLEFVECYFEPAKSLDYL
jgi:hypothetical protein